MNEYNPADQQAGIAYAERVASERFALLGERVTPATKMLMGCAFEAGAAHGRAAPADWKLVPVESSIEMEDAGCKAASRLMGLSEANRVYRAMLAAAPAAPVAVQEPVACCPYCGGASGRCDSSFPHPPIAQQPDTVPVPRAVLADIAQDAEDSGAPLLANRLRNLLAGGAE